MIREDDDGRPAQSFRSGVVAIVTGGSSGCGREIACALTVWGWALVIVYLEHQPVAEATVEDIMAAEGNVVAVRADLADELDVERLFAESIAAFARVDVVVHTMTGSASVLYEQAARHVRSQGAIVSVAGAELVIPDIARRLRERGISIGRAPPEQMLALLDRWRQGAFG